MTAGWMSLAASTPTLPGNGAIVMARVITHVVK